jgi:hypothetical protein
MKHLIKLLVLLISVLLINNTIASEDITGTWQGTLVPAPGNELVIQFIITENDDGSYSVVLDSPDQGAIKDIKASSVDYDSGSLKLDVTELSGSYEGIVKDGIIEGNWKQEGTSIPLNMSPYEKPVLTKEDMDRLLGQWHGQLEIPTGTHILVFRFEMEEKGEFKGFLDLPESGAKGLPVTDIELSENELKLKVPSASAEYKGEFADKEIVGEIKLGTQPFPVTLKKGEYKAPTYSLNLPEETMEALLGEWHGQLRMPTTILHVEFRFETTKEGEFVGFYGLPDQNVKGIPITEAEFGDGKLTLKIKVVNAEFKGQLAGDELTGEWAQAGLSNIPLSMKKGEYIPPVYSLDLPNETRELLSGEWYGELKTQTATVTVVLRFETTEKGEFVGFEEVPDQKVKGIPVIEASLSDGKLTLKVPSAEFKGQLAGDELTGEVIQAGRSSIPTPFTLKKGKYIPPVYSLDLPKEIMETLSGEWKGKLGPLTIVFRFERNEKGEFLGFLDSPDQGAKDIKITEASLSDGKLILKVKLVNGEYKGQLSDNSLVGEWTQAGAGTNPLTLTKEKPQVQGK